MEPHAPPISTYSQRLAAEIRACLGRSETTQAQLATAIGLSRQSLSRKLAGSGTFSVGEVQAVAAHFGVPASELLRRAEDAA